MLCCCVIQECSVIFVLSQNVVLNVYPRLLFEEVVSQEAYGAREYQRRMKNTGREEESSVCRNVAQLIRITNG